MLLTEVQYLFMFLSSEIRSISNVTHKSEVYHFMGLTLPIPIHIPNFCQEMEHYHLPRKILHSTPQSSHTSSPQNQPIF